MMVVRKPRGREKKDPKIYIKTDSKCPTSHKESLLLIVQMTMDS